MITCEVGAWKLSYSGLSTDEKPDHYDAPDGSAKKIPNSSMFYEMDTGVLFMWDAENNEWLEQ